MAQSHLQFRFLCFQYPAEKITNTFALLRNELQYLQQQNAIAKHRRLMFLRELIPKHNCFS